MRIGCLQFAPQLGDIDNNLNRADAVLCKSNPQNLDLLVLPELAFSGYNFQSLQHISPYLEPTTAGITSLWARTTALRYDCVVTVGYPEKVDVSSKWPTSPEYYNSAITVNPDGETIANYRKSFLYYTDETWALEGPDGFYDGAIEGLGNVAMGICMDLNPYKFEAPWSAWEFAYHVLHKEANLVILSMAWLTREDARAFSRTPKEPDMETLSYWLARLEPIIRAETQGELVVVIANRTGTEDEAVYAGTSCVLGIHLGEVKVYGILGRGERELLIVDTTMPPKAKLISDPHLKEKDGKESAGSSDSMKSDDSTRTEATQTTQESASNPDDDITLSMDDIMTPLSPVEPTSPHAFFAAKSRTAEGDILRSKLKSSMGQQEHRAPSPYSPTFHRPQSPKSRNASRTRHPQQQEQALLSHDLATEQPALRHDSPALKYDGPTMPHSASAVPEPNKRSPSRGPRSRHVSPRPKSAVW